MLNLMVIESGSMLRVSDKMIQHFIGLTRDFFLHSVGIVLPYEICFSISFYGYLFSHLNSCSLERNHMENCIMNVEKRISKQKMKFIIIEAKKKETIYCE